MAGRLGSKLESFPEAIEQPPLPLPPAAAGTVSTAPVGVGVEETVADAALIPAALVAVTEQV